MTLLPIIKQRTSHIGRASKRRQSKAALGACCALVMALSGAAHADGSAVFASVSTDAHERALSATLREALQVDIQTSRVWVDGVNWTRLHSAELSEPDARALVARARALGYSAWFNSSGNRWATQASESPALSDRQPFTETVAQPMQSDTRFGTGYRTSPAEVTPTSDDLSHLPMAETLPLEPPR